MREMERIGNQIEQVQTAMDGLIERLVQAEETLAGLEQSRKPLVYIDERTALLSSNEADIRFIESKEEANEVRMRK